MFSLTQIERERTQSAGKEHTDWFAEQAERLWSRLQRVLQMEGGQIGGRLREDGKLGRCVLRGQGEEMGGWTDGHGFFHLSQLTWHRCNSTWPSGAVLLQTTWVVQFHEHQNGSANMLTHLFCTWLSFIECEFFLMILSDLTLQKARKKYIKKTRNPSLD